MIVMYTQVYLDLCVGPSRYVSLCIDLFILTSVRSRESTLDRAASMAKAI